MAPSTGAHFRVTWARPGRAVTLAGAAKAAGAAAK
jgi:hypothetical protein